jgi:hypothetical protein
MMTTPTSAMMAMLRVLMVPPEPVGSYWRALPGACGPHTTCLPGAVAALRSEQLRALRGRTSRKRCCLGTASMTLSAGVESPSRVSARREDRVCAP